MFNIFKDTIARDLNAIANEYNANADSGTVFKDKKARAINRIKNAVLNGDVGATDPTVLSRLSAIEEDIPTIEAGVENAQWKTESSEQLFNETVTTETLEGNDYSEATLTYSGYITSDKLEVVFDGNKYICPKTIPYDGATSYGAPFDEEGYNFSEFPFVIGSYEDGTCGIVTQTSGEHTVSVTSINYTYTAEFTNAVKKQLPKGVRDGEGELSIILNSTDNTATGDYACAEGAFTNATGRSSHAEGENTTASGNHSHAEGENTTSSGPHSHAEGTQCVASNIASHAEGNNSQATGEFSHAQNENTIAQGMSQTVIGKNNIAQGNSTAYVDTDYAFIIGNGTPQSGRSNAFAVRWDGAIVLANGTILTVAQLAKVANLT